MSRSSADHPAPLSLVLEAELRRLRPGAPSMDPALDERGRCEQLRLQAANLNKPLAALCLSGGGIRSAAFALGVIQGLARADLLAEFDYLSTASGGGYVGGWLTAWTHRERGDIHRVQAALRSSDDPTPVVNLLSHSRYLRAHGRSEALGTVAILLRSFLVQCLTFLPIPWLAIIAPWMVLALVVGPTNDAFGQSLTWLFFFLAVVPGGFAVDWMKRNRPDESGRDPGSHELLFGYSIPVLFASIAWAIWFARTLRYNSDAPLPWLIFALVVVVLAGASIGAAILAHPLSEPKSRRHWARVLTMAIMPTLVVTWLTWHLALWPGLPAKTYVVLAPLIFLTSCALYSGTTLIVGWRHRAMRNTAWVRRIVAWTLQVAGAWAAICLLVFSAPAVLTGLGAWPAAGVLVGLLVFGVIGAAWSIVFPKLQYSWLATSAFWVILGVTLSSLTVGTNWLLDSASLAGLLGLTGLVVVLAAIMGLQFNVNRWSLSQVYRRQLTRVFLGASFTPLPGQTPRGNLAEDILVHSLEEHHRPLPVINMAVNLVADRPGGRELESFAVTPLYSGSFSLGYRPTCEFAGALSLGTSIGISGAAVSPVNTGEIPVSRATSLLLWLLMVRLGQWVGNPGDERRWRDAAPRWAYAAFTREAFGLKDTRNSYVYLSDAGHFDNLGLYEMIVRRCRYIVVSDAGYDPAFLFEDLRVSMQRACVDLDIPIHFDGRGVDEPISASVAVGRIEYSQVDGPGTPDGVLIYVKPVFDKDAPQEVAEYGKEAAIFPHHPTTDQSYDLRRFGSYRALGIHTIEVLTQGTSGTLAGWFEHLVPTKPVS